MFEQKHSIRETIVQKSMSSEIEDHRITFLLSLKKSRVEIQILGLYKVW